MITHLNKKNKPKIVDISKKEITNRVATAQGSIIFSKKTFNEIEKMQTKKGEITNVAILAGIMGAKKTSELIPLCHNIDISNVEIDSRKIGELVMIELKKLIWYHMLDSLQFTENLRIFQNSRLK